MKYLIMAIAGVLFFTNAFSQIKEPVNWSFIANKRGSGIYEITITAEVAKPWHLYSQNTPKGGPVPTKISFNNNPLIVKEGMLRENGKLEKINDKMFGVQVLYYSNKVVFTQIVRVKAGVSTNIAGSVNYMVCDDTQCLPPTKKVFDLKLQ